MRGENELAYTIEAALKSSYFQQPQSNFRVGDWVPRKRIPCPKPQLEIQRCVSEDFERQHHGRKIRRWGERLVQEAALLQQIEAQEATSAAVADARTLEERFREQAEKWDRETAHLSSPTQRFVNPSYQAILGMGNDHREDVIDLLLRDMQQNRREWFWALSYLTHENPIERKDAGKLDKMIDAWVRWGRKRHRGLR